MKIMVTGGCGFIGSNFIKYVFSKDKNVEILNIDKMTHAANSKSLSFTVHDSSLNYNFLKIDIYAIKRPLKQLYLITVLILLSISLLSHM